MQLQKGQTIKTERGYATIVTIDKSPYGNDLHIANMDYFYIVAIDGSWAGWIPNRECRDYRRDAIRAQYQKMLCNLDETQLNDISFQSKYNHNIAMAANCILSERKADREFCPLCGELWLSHTYIPGSATQPGEYECLPVDSRDKFDVESGNWQESWNDTYDQLGWNRDIPF